MITALRTLGDNRLELARGYVSRLECDVALDPLERALATLAAAQLARATGASDAAALLAKAIDLAADAGADPEIVAELDSWLGDAVKDAGSTTPIAIDRKRHAIQIGGKSVLALGSRPALRSLLYALADSSGTCVDKARLAMAIWPGKYRPDRHDSALWVNLKRLRDLLSGTGLRIVTEPSGYCIVAESGFQLLY